MDMLLENEPDHVKRGSSSLNTFLSSLLINTLIFVLLISTFFALRSKFTRIYSPRTFAGSVPPKKRPKRLPSNPIAFVKTLFNLSDTYVIGKTSLDGYLFLRLLKIIAFITSMGCITVSVILLPIHRTGAGGNDGLDAFSLSNIGRDQKKRYYAHAVVSVFFFSTILLVIYRELRFFIALRNAYALSKGFTSRISAKTVLLTSVPPQYKHSDRLKDIFAQVGRVWMTGNTDSIQDLLDKRSKLVHNLEQAELEYIQNVDKKRRTGHRQDEEGRLVGSEWSAKEDRPTIKTFLIFGKKLDAIEHYRTEFAKVNSQYRQACEEHEASSKNSAFIQFETQKQAQIAYQCVTADVPLHMAPRYISLHPEEIIWSNLSRRWWQRLFGMSLAIAFTFFLILFWTIPVGLVGAISNIDALTERFSWLRWIDDLPDMLLSPIKGFLPAALLAMLMAIVPIILRLVFQYIAGAPAFSVIELQVQKAYFAFQVVQVFLITTISNSAAEVFVQIAKNPSSAVDVLAKNLPKSANFYISYIILQGLSLSASQLMQLAVLLTIKLLGPLLDKTPRKRWQRWVDLAELQWGTVFPVYTNLFVITISYAFINPLILPPATAGILVFYLAFKYNFVFVYNNTVDTKGMVYPLALQQMLTGVYLGELCLFGMLSLHKAKGPATIVLISFIGTIFYHIVIKIALGELLNNIPLALLAEDQREGFDIPRLNNDKPVSLLAFLHPTPQDVKNLANNVLSDIIPDKEHEDQAYSHPALTAPDPVIWLPEDAAGVSKEEMDDGRAAGIQSSDENAWIDKETGKLVWKPLKAEAGEEEEGNGEHVNPPDYKEIRIF